MGRSVLPVVCKGEIAMEETLQKAAILCVDDEIIVLDSLKRELRQVLNQQYSLELAESGQDGIEVMEELLEDGYDVPVVIVDYIMPDMKGADLLRHIHTRSPGTRTILLTGQADAEGIARAVNEANLYRYIAKPWQKEDLALTVKEAIRSYLQDKTLEKKTSGTGTT